MFNFEKMLILDFLSIFKGYFALSGQISLFQRKIARKNIGNPYKPYKYPIFELFHYQIRKNRHQISGKY